jgi:hypothetical protein
MMIRYATEFVFPTESRKGVVDHDHIEVDDGAQALIVVVMTPQETHSDGMFSVELRSWSENGREDSHTLFNSLRGKRVRVTVEALD